MSETEWEAPVQQDDPLRDDDRDDEELLEAHEGEDEDEQEEPLPGE